MLRTRPKRALVANLAVGHHFEGTDWRISATHYSRGGDQTSVDRVVDAALDQILAQGSFREAETFVATGTESDTRIAALILRSRAELIRGEVLDAQSLAEAAVDRAEADQDARLGLCLLNLATTQALAGPQEAAVTLATRALKEALTPSQRDVAQALLALRDAAHDGDLGLIARLLKRLAARQAGSREFHYAAVTRLNLALVLFWKGDVIDSLRAANEAEALFLASSRGAELGAVAAARARALAHLGRTEEAKRALEDAADDDNDARRAEVLLEGALIHSHYGDLEDARLSLAAAGIPIGQKAFLTGVWALARAELGLREGDLGAAEDALVLLRHHGLGSDASMLMRSHLLAARIALRRGQPADDDVAEATRLANTQRSRLGQSLCGVLGEIARGGGRGTSIVAIREADRGLLSTLAEELIDAFEELSDEARYILAEEWRARPERWRSAILQAALARRTGPMFDALVTVGGFGELRALREAAGRDSRVRLAAQELHRRLAPRLQIHDLGPVSLEVGSVQIPGHRVRRRVLALVCFLAAKPSMAASKDEVLDQLWPDLAPDTAVNSLNQTIYFLRRVIDPEYREGVSAPYIRFDGETLGLDPGLVTVDSARCRSLIAEVRRGNAEAIADVVSLYVGKFALDFAYEEWSTLHRDRLHAAVLGALEFGIERERRAGRLQAAVELAQRALELEPESDEFERRLLQVYRQAGQHAAAAEQYAHYATVLREDLGIEPPPLDDL